MLFLTVFSFVSGELLRAVSLMFFSFSDSFSYRAFLLIYSFIYLLLEDIFGYSQILIILLFFAIYIPFGKKYDIIEKSL